MQLRHVERFGNDPLPREGRIAMHEQRQNFTATLGVAANSLPRARGAFHDGINRFEMARISSETNLNFGAGRKFAYRPIAEVILYVAIAAYQIGNIIFSELGEDDLERFTQKIREHV